VCKYGFGSLKALIGGIERDSEAIDDIAKLCDKSFKFGRRPVVNERIKSGVRPCVGLG
jgi:hypothetical protein